MTLGDVGRKKYFIGVLFHFGQKMRLGLGSMTFQTFLYFPDSLGLNHSRFVLVKIDLFLDAH